MLLTLIAVVLTQTPEPCLDANASCLVGTVKRPVLAVVARGTHWFSLLGVSRQTRVVYAIVEFELTQGEPRRVGCTDVVFAQHEVLRKNYALCTKQVLPSAAAQLDAAEYARLERSFGEYPAGVRAGCFLAMRGAWRSDAGCEAAALELCGENSTAEPAQYKLEFDADGGLTSKACLSLLPEDGAFISALRRAPMEVTPTSLVFSDACRDTDATETLVHYRLDASGRVWRERESTRSKRPPH